MQADCREDTWTGGPGTTFFLPRGFTHTFRSVDGPATILFIVTPGRLDEFFLLRESGADPEASPTWRAGCSDVPRAQGGAVPRRPARKRAVDIQGRVGTDTSLENQGSPHVRAMCARGELNPHPRRDQDLNLACLPFHHSRVVPR